MLHPTRTRFFFELPEVREALRSSGWLIADKLTRIGAALVIAIWMARQFGPAEFGNYNYALAVVALFGPLVSLGVEGIVVRDLVRFPSRSAEILGTAAGLRVIASVASVLLCAATADALRASPGISELIAVLSFSLIFAVTDVIDLWFQARVDARSIVIGRLFSLVFGFALRVYLLTISAPIVTYAWVQLAELATAAGGVFMLYRYRQEGVGLWRFEIAEAGRMFREAWPLILAGLSVVLYMRIDIVMLEHLAGAVETGIYSAATRLSESFYFVPMAIVTSFAPMTIKAMADGHDLHEASFLRLYVLMVRLGLTAAVVLTLAAPMLVGVLYGEEYQGAANVLQLHVWAAIPVFLGVASSQYLTNKGLQIISFYRTGIGLMLNVALNLVWIPDHGAVGAAAATLVSYMVATFALGCFPRTRSQFKLFMRALHPSVVFGRTA